MFLKFCKSVVAMSVVGFSLVATASDYRCQIVSEPGVFYRDMNWDGNTPFKYPIQYDGRLGELRISSIGLPGHPDYLFEINIEGRALVSVSQERNLKDYVINWKSDGEQMAGAVISIACRTTGDAED